MDILIGWHRKNNCSVQQNKYNVRINLDTFLLFSIGTVNLEVQIKCLHLFLLKIYAEPHTEDYETSWREAIILQFTLALDPMI